MGLGSSLGCGLLKGVQRRTQPIKSAAHRLRRPTEADAKVLRLLKEFSRHHAGVKLLAQQGHKAGGIAGLEPWEDRRAEPTGLAIQLPAGPEEFIEQGSIRFQQRPRPISNLIQMI